MSKNTIKRNDLQLDGCAFSDLFHAQGLARLDQRFLNALKQADSDLYTRLINYRSSSPLTPEATSQLIIDCAPLLEEFLGRLFGITEALEGARLATLAHAPIFAFKRWYVLKQARRRLRKAEPLPAFAVLDDWLTDALKTHTASTPALARIFHEKSTAATVNQSWTALQKKKRIRRMYNTPSSLFSSAPCPGLIYSRLATISHEICGLDRELAVACLGQHYLTDQIKYAESIEKLIQWCVLALTDPTAQAAVAAWVSFKLPAKRDPDKLIAPIKHYRHRDGFALTDSRMSQREILAEVDYCVYCHDKAGDFCSKGFPQKKTQPEMGLKVGPLGDILTGCPVDEKISEMHLLKRRGYTLGALATIMADNPMCPATGHRICNDCMKACIYQKQDPVNIPEVETGVLTEVLKLPWGVELYDLLTRWNPLRATQWVAKPYNGLKILVMGMGPAGFSLAHHLLMEGFAVVGADGLKIEPLSTDLLTKPVYSYSDLCEALDKRIVNGFGGVAEYGITVRWDKNFLKLIYMSLLRRPYFQVFGSVRFGGTLTVEDAWGLGFDHLAVAVGAGLPKALPIPGSLAPGMRQANDFLMALQLTGAAKANSLANLQLRLPAVVIGGGLTGVDTATEVQAYYIVQIEKMLSRYEQQVAKTGEADLRKRFSEKDLLILDELLTHGRAVRREREQAQAESRLPDLIGLIRQWGGVTIVYRRTLQESPAYRGNHEELAKALEEGIYYREGLEPRAAVLDEFGDVSALTCRVRRQDENGRWHQTEETVTLPASAVFVATGAEPNIAYEFEQRGTFAKLGWQYKRFEHTPSGLLEVGAPSDTNEQRHCKSQHFGPFTSYQKEGRRVSFLGDTHPVFHGSVVKAIASGKRTYPAIIDLFKQKLAEKLPTDRLETDYRAFRDRLNTLFYAEVVDVKRCNKKVIELTVRAPLATRNFEPGHFYRVQSFESLAPSVKGTVLQTEAIALVAAQVDKTEGLIRFIVNDVGTSSRLVAGWRVGMPVSVMGPTGVRNKIPKEPQTILLVSDNLGIPQVCALGPALRKAGHQVLLLLNLRSEDELYHRAWIEAAADQILPVTGGDPVNTLLNYAKTASAKLAEVKRVVVTGNSGFVKHFQSAFAGELRPYFKADPEITGSVYGPMQCMLKGVCAQCLQWQIDPSTGKRTKAVYACSWQDQPIAIVAFDNLEERLGQNSVQETLTNAWLEGALEES